MSEIKLDMPFDKSELKKLRAGDNVLLSGEMFVFRDAGHKRLFASIEKGNPDIALTGETVYFMGPCPAQKDQIMGVGAPPPPPPGQKTPPSSSDPGLAAHIGQGKRSLNVMAALKGNGGCYLAGMGGAGAMNRKWVTAVKEICYSDLGTEAIRRITVKDFPVVVAIDSEGNSVYNE